MGAFWSFAKPALPEWFHHKPKGTVRVYVALSHFSHQADPLRYLKNTFLRACPMLSDSPRFLELVREAHSSLYYLGSGRGVIFEITQLGGRDVSMVYHVI